MLGHYIDYATTYGTSRAGQFAMQFSFAPTIGYRVNDSGLYDSEDIGSLAIPCSAAEPFGLRRGYCPGYWDWEHTGEPKARVYGNLRGSDVVTYPFGWHNLFSHCAKGYAFAEISDSTDYWPVFWLRDRTFHPMKMISDYDDLWNVSFRTYYWGYYYPV